MRILILIVSICFVFAIDCSWAQSSVLNRVDRDGLKQGHWVVRYKNGQIKYDGYFKDGKPYGLMHRYYSFGRLKAQLRYDTVSHTARAKLYKENGNLFAEGNFKNNKKDSVWNYYSEGRKIEKITYKKGQKSGSYLAMFADGTIRVKAQYSNDLLVGNYYIYYKNGERKCGFKYAAGKRNGLCMTWYENGTTELSGGYIDNKRHGDWNYYNENGDVQYTLKYFNGKLQNPEVINDKSRVEFEMLEQNKLKLKDPEHYRNNPGELMRR